MKTLYGIARTEKKTCRVNATLANKSKSVSL